MAGGALLGGAASYFGQQETNAMNREMQDKQMAFEERMSSTAHQREVKDLRDAGINPILSAGGGGASTPSVGMPSMSSPGQAGVQGGLSGASSAMSMLQSAKDLQVKDSQIQLNNAQTGGKSFGSTVTKDADEFYRYLRDGVMRMWSRTGAKQQEDAPQRGSTFNQTGGGLQ